jgi:hypothetical protein
MMTVGEQEGKLCSAYVFTLMCLPAGKLGKDLSEAPVDKSLLG